MADTLLQITLVRGSELADVKKFEWGKQDPYVLVQYNEYEFRTKTDEDGHKTPVWNETFSFNIQSNPDVTLTVLHDRKKHDDVLGTAKYAWANAQAKGYAHETIPLFTTEGKQQGFLEIVVKFPEVIARIQAQQAAEAAAREMEALRLAEARAAYAAALGEALKVRKAKAAAKLAEQEAVIDSSLIPLYGTDAFERHEVAYVDTKASFEGSYSSKNVTLIREVTVDTDAYSTKLKKDLDDDEDFGDELSTLSASIAAASASRDSSIASAKAAFDQALILAAELYLKQLQGIKETFVASVNGAAMRYKGEARTKINFLQEAKALQDVAHLKP